MTDTARAIDDTYDTVQLEDPGPHREEQDRIDWAERAHFKEPYAEGDFEKPYDPDDYLNWDDDEDY